MNYPKITSMLLSFIFLLSGCAGGSGSNVTPSPEPAPPQFAYVLNSGDNTISQLRLGSAGELTPFTVQTVPTGNFPRSMVMDKLHNFLYVANLGDDTISQYSIGSDGALTLLPSTIATGTTPQTIVISPDSRFVYSINMTNDTIVQYTIGVDGELSLTSIIPHADTPVNMVFSPSGHYAYVVNAAINEISQYAVGTDGSLNALNPATVRSAGCPSGPLGSKKTKNGNEVVYVLSCSTDEIEVYAVGSNGALTSQQVVTTGSVPEAMEISEANVYTVNYGDATMSMFAVEANGNLQPLIQPTVAAGSQPQNMTIDKTGKFAYVLDFAMDQILQYAITVSGQLIPSTKAPVSSGNSPMQIIVR